MQSFQLQLSHISGPPYGKDGLKMTLPRDKWQYMDLEFCSIYSTVSTYFMYVL